MVALLFFSIHLKQMSRIYILYEPQNSAIKNTTCPAKKEEIVMEIYTIYKLWFLECDNEKT